MLEPPLLALALALSLFTGTLMGLIGGGGGFVYVFMLTVLFGVAPATAIGTGLALAALGATVAAASHWRRGNVSWRHAAPLAGVGTVAALAGGAFTATIAEDTLRWLIVVLFVVLGAQPLMTRRSGGEEAAPRRGGLLRSGIAVPIGFGVGAFGISGGAPLSSYLSSLEGLSGARAVGTAMLVVTPMSLAGAATFLTRGSFSPMWFAVLALGAAAGSWLGAGLTRRVDDRKLTIALGVLTLASSAGLAFGIHG